MAGRRSKPERDREFARKMREVANPGDPEREHAAADKLLCEALRFHGYSEGLKIYEAMTRWCA